MFSKLIAAVAVFGFSLLCVIACNNDTNAPSPQSLDFGQSAFVDLTDAEEFDANEIFDDADSQSKAAAIDTAMQVKVQLKVTSACSVTGSAGFKYIEGAVSSPTLSYSAAGSALGFKSFSVPRAKFNIALLKTFDKTKAYTIFIYVPGTPKSGPTPTTMASYKKVVVLPANPTAAKKKNAKGKSIGRPITAIVTSLGCS